MSITPEPARAEPVGGRLPCPFCGKYPTINTVRNGNCQLHGEKLYKHVVSCSNHATFSHPSSMADAVAQWNSRADCVPASDAGLAEVEQENTVLRAALSALPAIAEECRLKWDASMKAGKLLIALTDPTIRYRADITELHRVAALPTKREEAQAATIAALRADNDRLKADAAGRGEGVSAELRALSERATKGDWRVETNTTLVWGDCVVDDDGYVERMGVPVVDAQLARGWSRDGQPDHETAQYNAALSAAAVNDLRARIAAAPAPATDGTGGQSDE